MILNANEFAQKVNTCQSFVLKIAIKIVLCNITFKKFPLFKLFVIILIICYYS